MVTRYRFYFQAYVVVVLFATALTLVTPSNASQINWRSPIATVSVTSDGTTLMDSTFEFQLGSFADGFMPSIDNTEEWAAHWRTLDTTTYNGTTRFFSSTVLLTSNDPPFTAGTSGFIWGRNSNGGANNEWVLMRSVRWRWPVSSSGVAFPVDWDVDESAIAIVGEMHGADFLMKTARVATSSGNAADQWLAQHFTEQQIADPDVGGWNADPDFDGVRNLVEFTTDGNPLQVDAHLSSSRWIQSNTSPSFTLRLPVSNAARNLVSIKLQFSSNLKAWLPLPTMGSYDDEGISFSVAPGNAKLYYRLIVDFQ